MGEKCWCPLVMGYVEDCEEEDCPHKPCPKVEKPTCYYRSGVETGQCAVCEWFKQCPSQGHSEVEKR